MREILFRGKRIDDGKWIEGGITFSLDQEYVFIAPERFSDYDDEICIDKNTLGQYTGLLDKNGKKIFEGDIIKHKLGKTAGGGNLYSKFCVNFSLDYGGFQAFANGLQGYCYPSLTLGKITWKPEDNEIIGNIYDNPELLEE